MAHAPRTQITATPRTPACLVSSGMLVKQSYSVPTNGRRGSPAHFSNPMTGLSAHCLLLAVAWIFATACGSGKSGVPAEDGGGPPREEDASPARPIDADLPPNPIADCDGAFNWPSQPSEGLSVDFDIPFEDASTGDISGVEALHATPVGAVIVGRTQGFVVDIEGGEVASTWPTPPGLDLDFGVRSGDTVGATGFVPGEVRFCAFNLATALANTDCISYDGARIPVFTKASTGGFEAIDEQGLQQVRTLVFDTSPKLTASRSLEVPGDLLNQVRFFQPLAEHWLVGLRGDPRESNEAELVATVFPRTGNSPPVSHELQSGRYDVTYAVSATSPQATAVAFGGSCKDDRRQGREDIAIFSSTDPAAPPTLHRIAPRQFSYIFLEWDGGSFVMLTMNENDDVLSLVMFRFAQDGALISRTPLPLSYEKDDINLLLARFSFAAVGPGDYMVAYTTSENAWTNRVARFRLTD